MVDITLPMEEKISKLISSLFVEKSEISLITLTRIANIFHITVEDLVRDSYILTDRDYWPNYRPIREVEYAIEKKKKLEKEELEKKEKPIISLKLGGIDDIEDIESKLFFEQRKTELLLEYDDPKIKRLIDMYVAIEIQLWRIERAMRRMYLQYGDDTFVIDKYKRLADIFKTISNIYHSIGDRFKTILVAQNKQLEIQEKKEVEKGKEIEEEKAEEKIEEEEIKEEEIEEEEIEEEEIEKIKEVIRISKEQQEKEEEEEKELLKRKGMI